MSLANCDLGASPTLQPKTLKPARMSPLHQARTTGLRTQKKKWIWIAQWLKFKLEIIRLQGSYTQICKIKEAVSFSDYLHDLVH